MNIILKTAIRTLALNETALEKNPLNSDLKKVIFRLKKIIARLEDEQSVRARMIWNWTSKRSDKVRRQAAAADVLSSAAKLGLSISLSLHASWSEISAARSTLIVAQTIANFKNVFSPDAENFSAPGGFRKSLASWRAIHTEQKNEERGSAGSIDSGLSIKRPNLKF